MEWECGGLKTSRAPIASHHPDASGLVAAEVTTFETFPVLGVGLGPRLSELPDLSLSAPPALRGSCAPPSPSQEPRSRRDPLPTLSRARAPLSSSCPVDGAEPSLLPRLPRWSRPAPPEPAFSRLHPPGTPWEALPAALQEARVRKAGQRLRRGRDGTETGSELGTAGALRTKAGTRAGQQQGRAGAAARSLVAPPPPGSRPPGARGLRGLGRRLVGPT